MAASAVYPPEFGKAIGSILVWRQQAGDQTMLDSCARDLAQNMKPAEDVFAMVKAKIDEIGWTDTDPGWPGVEDILVPPPNPELVRLALRKRRLEKETARRAALVSDSSEVDSWEFLPRDSSPILGGCLAYFRVVNSNVIVLVSCLLSLAIMVVVAPLLSKATHCVQLALS